MQKENSNFVHHEKSGSVEYVIRRAHDIDLAMSYMKGKERQKKSESNHKKFIIEASVFQSVLRNNLAEILNIALAMDMVFRWG